MRRNRALTPASCHAAGMLVMSAMISLIGRSLRRLGCIHSPNNSFLKMTNLEGMPPIFGSLRRD
jgi:hypothetical protein